MQQTGQLCNIFCDAECDAEGRKNSPPCAETPMDVNWVCGAMSEACWTKRQFMLNGNQPTEITFGCCE